MLVWETIFCCPKKSEAISSSTVWTLRQCAGEFQNRFFQWTTCLSRTLLYNQWFHASTLLTWLRWGNIISFVSLTLTDRQINIYINYKAFMHIKNAAPSWCRDMVLWFLPFHSSCQGLTSMLSTIRNLLQIGITNAMEYLTVDNSVAVPYQNRSALVGDICTGKIHV